MRDHPRDEQRGPRRERYLCRWRCLPGARGGLSRGRSPGPQGLRRLQRLAADSVAGPGQCEHDRRERARGRGGRLDCRAHRARRHLRHIRHPAGLALPGEGCQGHCAHGQALDDGQYRQRAGRPRDGPAFTRTGRGRGRAGAFQQGRPLAVPQRLGCGGPGGAATDGQSRMTSAAVSHRPISVALGGFIALAVAMGIGRFVYTPILPFMAEGLGLTKGEAGLIASANFLGYLLGALGASSAALPGGRRAWAIAALAVSALSTGIMGLSSSLPVFLVLRFIGGVASAFALVFASALVLDRLTAAGRPALIALYFAGVGSGIVLSALLVAGLAAAGYDWRVFWLASGALSLLGLGAVVRLVPGMAEVKPAAAAQRGGPIDRRLRALIAAYGLFGFGYVITATFISTIVRSSPDLQSLEPVVWLIVGLAAIPSVAIWAWVGRRIGNGRGFAIACVATAAVLLGGTFVGITATGLVNARELSTADPRRSLALMTAIFGVGQMIGPTFAGFVHDLSGNFRLPSLAAAAALVIAAALVGATASGPAAARRRC